MESGERQRLGGRLGEQARAEAVLGGMEIVLSYLQSAPRAIRSNTYRVRQDSGPSVGHGVGECGSRHGGCL